MRELVADNEKIHELAVSALRKMLDRFGPEYRFPTDAIWQFIPDGLEIRSTQKPHQPRRLVKEGYLQDTGAKTKAQSGPRAGSPTTEYRFGPLLVPSHTYEAVDFIPPSGEPITHIDYSHAVLGMQEAMEAEGYIISPAELANFLLAMTVSPLVILSGISGTGKSLLPRKFSKFTNSLYCQIPVQPQWSDNSDLFGYVPSLASNVFVKGKIIDAVLGAKRNPGLLSIAVLDEMNLAPVEHYFSDFLSVAESRLRKDDVVGSDPLPIDLPIEPGQEYLSVCEELRGIELPCNLRVVGTANVDETTHVFSPKVLDRAFTIEFDEPDLTAFPVRTKIAKGSFDLLAQAVIGRANPINIMEAQAESQELFEYIAMLLEEIQVILSPAGVKFGYRTRDAILLYLHFWRKFKLSDVLAGCAALDFCILQKILPKISGSGEALESALKKLVEWLDERSILSDTVTAFDAEFIGSLARSRDKTVRMLTLLELDGATRYWGA